MGKEVHYAKLEEIEEMLLMSYVELNQSMCPTRNSSPILNFDLACRVIRTSNKCSCLEIFDQ